MEEAAAEVTNLKAIIEVKAQSWGSSYYISFCWINKRSTYSCLLVLQSLIRREGHLMVIADGTQRGEDGENARSSTSRNDRILAVAPNYVID